VNATTSERATVHRLSRAQLRQRWLEMIDDPLLAAIPYKVELNEKGSIEVSPASNRHGIMQAFVTGEFAKQRPDGTTITECSVETRIGVRVPDVAWTSRDFIGRHGVANPFPSAPEICVEVLSPSNTAAEISERVAAYLEAGTIEVWLVRDDGGVEIITKSGPSPSSSFGIELVVPP
jgi:Uma2 family endonuclease